MGEAEGGFGGGSYYILGHLVLRSPHNQLVTDTQMIANIRCSTYLLCEITLTLVIVRPSGTSVRNLRNFNIHIP